MAPGKLLRGCLSGTIQSLKTENAFLYAVREVRNCWIPLSSGERLAARVWLPDVPDGKLVPAVMEFSIYRKSDVQAVRDTAIYGYLAGHGYACVRVECRGTGDSDGLQTDQFAAEYIDDALESLRWVARQPWCRGKVAMTGLSWPGHMCLQVAARNPPELGAIVPMDAADDRYTNKYHGGCLLHYGFTISTALLGMHARPPLPEHVGERWRDTWRRRVENAAVFLEHWLAHPVRDAYWAAGSVVEHYAQMRVPMYAACGLSDPGYAVCTPRMLDRYGGPRRLLVGPWAHRMPHMPIPGPGANFLDSVRRWLDACMNDAVVEEAPGQALTAWIFGAEPPAAQVEAFSGRWVTESGWIPPDLEMRRFSICAGGLSTGPEEERVVEVSSPLTVGTAGGEWMPWFVAGNGPELSGDQREDDAVSACFDSLPLEDGADVFGQARAELEVASDQPCGQVALRLCSVAPDGTSKRLSFGFLDLGQREGDDRRLPVLPGERYRIEVPLLPASHHVPRGHRLRLAVSTSYWPMIWPASRRVRLSIFAGRGVLSIPIRPSRPEDSAAVELGEPTLAPGLAASVMRKPTARRILSRDLASGETTLSIEEDGGRTRIDDRAIEVEWTGKRSASIRPNDPLSATAYAEWTWVLRFGNIETITHASTRLGCTAASFEIDAYVEAIEGGQPVAKKRIKRSVPRVGI